MTRQIILIACILLLAITACGPQQTQQQPPTQTQTSTDTPSAPSAPASPPSQTTAQTAPTTSTNAPAPATVVPQALKAQSTIQYQATYTLNSKVQGNAFTGVLTHYMKSATKIRMDMTTQGIETQTYFIDGVVNACNKASGSWMCIKTDVATPDSTAAAQQVVENPSNYTITASGSRQIAGTTASCFDIKGIKDTATYTYCYSPEYVPLYVHLVTDNMTTEMTATTYSTTVADSVFVVPQAAKTVNANDYLKNMPNYG